MKIMYYLCGAFAKVTLQNDMRDQLISHQGVVKAIEGERVRVSILQAAACAGCAAKQMCSSAEAKEKEVEVMTSEAHRYRVGQEVMLEGHLSDGRRAAMIAYGLPLVLLLLALVVGLQMTGSETVGALGALSTVVVYYAVIFLFFRQRLQQTFSFIIKQ